MKRENGVSTFQYKINNSLNYLKTTLIKIFLPDFSKQNKLREIEQRL